jgi:hypothetical protein
MDRDRPALEKDPVLQRTEEMLLETRRLIDDLQSSQEKFRRTVIPPIPPTRADRREG